MLTDTHAHLDFPDFAADQDAVVERAAAAGVTRLITIGTSVASSRRAVELAQRYPGVWAVVGIHPNSAVGAAPGDLAELRELAAAPKVAAIGETGIDHFRLPAEGASTVRTRQAEIFRCQLELAEELKLNVVIHQRAAWEATWEVLRPFTGRLRGVFHCFGETPERAAEVYAEGHLVSFTGIVTFKNAAAAQASARAVDCYMVETDSPFLAPVPYRGQRCEPAYVRQIAEQVAQLRSETLEQVAAQTERTANAFFRLG